MSALIEVRHAFPQLEVELEDVVQQPRWHWGGRAKSALKECPAVGLVGRHPAANREELPDGCGSHI